jgi:hypothetical protein
MTIGEIRIADYQLGVTYRRERKHVAVMAPVL